jgi:hypothetical protein
VRLWLVEVPTAPIAVVRDLPSLLTSTSLLWGVSKKSCAVGQITVITPPSEEFKKPAAREIGRGLFQLLPDPAFLVVLPFAVLPAF